MNADVNTVIRLIVDGEERTVRDLRRVGTEGRRALDGVERGARQSAVALDRVDREARGAARGLSQMAASEPAVGRLALSFGALSGSLLAGGGIGFAIFAIGREARQSANELAAIGDAADRAGASVGLFQNLQGALRLSGQPEEQLEAALAAINRRVGEARAQIPEAVRVFNALNIELDADGRTRPLEDILLDLADVFAAIPDPATRAAVAQKLFEESGRSLLPVLSLGSAGLQDLIARARETGQVFSDELVRDAQGATVALNSVLSQAVNPLKEGFVSLALSAAVALDQVLNSTARLQQDVTLQARLAELRAEQEGEIARRDTAVDRLSRGGGARVISRETRARDGANLRLQEIGLEIRQIQSELDQRNGETGGQSDSAEDALRLALEDLDLGGGGGGGSAASARPESGDAATSRLLERLRLIGTDDRARFIAGERNRAGANATPEELAAIEDLAGRLFDLERVQALVNRANREGARIKERETDRLRRLAETIRADARPESERYAQALADLNAIQDQLSDAEFDFALGDIRDEFEGVTQAVTSAGDVMEGVFDSLAANGFQGVDVLKLLRRELISFGVELARTNLINPLFQQGTNALSGGLSSLFGVTPRAAAFGGSFTVPGAGAHDSVRAVLDVTPGEVIDVRRPGEPGGGAGGAPVFNFYGPVGDGITSDPGGALAPAIAQIDAAFGRQAGRSRRRL